MTRILFVGDLQLGAGQQYGTAERPRLADQAEAWEWIVAQALDEWDVDKIVLLGDVFDKRNPTPDEELAFVTPLQHFDETDVLAVIGNHDVSTETAATSLEVFEAAGLLAAHRTPGVWGNVATLPWTPPHRLAAAHGREQINERVAAYLVECTRELKHTKSGPHGATPDILALHWSISGGVTASGVETISLPEPVLPLEDLCELGYRWIVAGHIHKAQLLGDEDAATAVIVAGSPMVSDFGEAEGEHGVWVIDTETEAIEFFQVPDRNFVTHNLDLSTHEGIFALASLPPIPTDAVIRIRYTATPEQAAQIDHAAIERALYEAGVHKVYAIEPTIIRERRARAEHVDETLEPLDALDAWAAAESLDSETATALREYTARVMA